MATRLIVERFLFLIVAFVGVILLFHTLMIKILQDVFFMDYLTSSCASGVVVLTSLYVLVKFNRNIEKQISNFLYFKGKRHYKVLLKEAITDGLTGLYDHKYFQLRLDEEFERAKKGSQPLSLLMIDIDQFKKYNDTFGHPAGDAVLERLGRLFARLSKKSDIAVRYGGEEFSIILPETAREGAVALAERFREEVEKAEFKEGGGVTVSVGVGVFNGVDNVSAKEELVKLADEALYRAKAGGRNKVEV